MKKKSMFAWLSCLFIQLLFTCLLSAQNMEAPQLPAVDVEFKLLSTPLVGGEAEVSLKVTPLVNADLDISVIVPEGFKAKLEDGFPVMPQNGASTDPVSGRNYIESINLFVGPVKANETKEYIFHIIISEQGKHTILAQIQDLMKYGVIQKSLEIGG